MRTVCEDAGLALVAAGVAMVNIPAGVIVGGLLIVLAANLHGGVRRPAAPSPVPCRCGHSEAEHQADGHRPCALCYCGGFHRLLVDPEPSVGPTSPSGVSSARSDA